MSFGDYQLEIYLKGPNGVLPDLPMAFDELEARAEKALPPSFHRELPPAAWTVPGQLATR